MSEFQHSALVVFVCIRKRNCSSMQKDYHLGDAHGKGTCRGPLGSPDCTCRLWEGLPYHPRLDVSRPHHTVHALSSPKLDVNRTHHSWRAVPPNQLSVLHAQCKVGWSKSCATPLEFPPRTPRFAPAATVAAASFPPDLLPNARGCSSLLLPRDASTADNNILHFRVAKA